MARYFDRQWDVPTRGDVRLRVYGAGSMLCEAEVLFVLLHGAGATSLTWAVFADELLARLRLGPSHESAEHSVDTAQEQPQRSVQAHDVHQGRGHAIEPSAFGSTLKNVAVLAYDMRGHGASSGDAADTSLEVLTADLVCALESVAEEHAPHACAPLRVILVGHSVGGAVATRAVSSGALASLEGVELAGLVVVDASEQAAAAGIPRMRHFVEAVRPRAFASLDDAVRWATRRSDSASEPIPEVSERRAALLTATPTRIPLDALPARGREFPPPGALGLSADVRSYGASGPAAASTVPSGYSQVPGRHGPVPHGGAEPRRAEAIAASLADQLVLDANSMLVWRTDVLRTEPHWAPWFSGLSSAFASIGRSVPRLLVLASDREQLDRALMIHAMRGEFQHTAVPGAGHAVQEDCPARLADIVASFAEHHLRTVSGFRVDGPIR